MATGTQLYNKDKQVIYPNSVATLIQMDAASFNNQSTEDCIIELYSKIDQLSGAQQQKDSIIINVYYCRLTSSDEEAAKKATWQDQFVLPNATYPYTWKKTEIKTSVADTNPKIIYEIVAADIAERSQTIYLSPSTSGEIKVVYPTKGNDAQGNPVIDEAQVQKDDWLPYTVSGEQWSFTLMELSPTNPEIYSATRVKKNGKWGIYSDPVRIAKWTFDSIIKLKYKTTGLNDDAPSLTNNEDLDTTWQDSVNIDNDFTGKIWMVSATFVNGAIVKNTDETYWSGPNLISIIK